MEYSHILSAFHEIPFLFFELELRASPGAPSGCSPVATFTLVKKYWKTIFLLVNGFLMVNSCLFRCTSMLVFFPKPPATA